MRFKIGPRHTRVVRRNGWRLPLRTRAGRDPSEQGRGGNPSARGRGATQDLAHPQGTNPGIFAFTGRCASCHDTGKDGAKDRYTLNRRTPEEVLASMTTGSMAKYADGLTEFEKRVVAVYVGGRPLGAAATGDASQMKNRCESRPAFALSKASDWNGWGVDSNNSRFQKSPGLTAADAPKLALKWAFGFPMGNSAYGQPAVVGGRVFVGADTGFVYSLDAATGCIHWSFRPTPACGRRSASATGDADNRVPRLLRRRERQRLRGQCRNRHAGLEGSDRSASDRARDGRADAGAGHACTCRCRRSRNRAPATRAYPCCTFRGGVGRVRRRGRNTPLEVVHDRRGAEAR